MIGKNQILSAQDLFFSGNKFRFVVSYITIADPNGYLRRPDLYSDSE